MDLSSIIKNYRKENRMNVEKFAKKANLSRAYIYMLETGINPGNGKKIVPTIETIRKISTVLGITIDDLIRMINENDYVSLIAEHDDNVYWKALIMDEINQADTETLEKIHKMIQLLK